MRSGDGRSCAAETIAVWGAARRLGPRRHRRDLHRDDGGRGRIHDAWFMDTHRITTSAGDLGDLAETVMRYRRGFGYSSDDGAPLGWVGIIVAGCGDDVWRTVVQTHDG